jgi:dipeptidyl aminopeptidase/acylaminoacyl peptidase
VRFKIIVSSAALTIWVNTGLCAEPIQASALPIDQFTRFDEFGNVKLAPDGQYLALTTGKRGRSILAFYDRQAKKFVGKIESQDRFEIESLQWVSNTRLIYTLAERYPWEVTPVSTGEILAIDRDGRNQQFIYGYRAGQKQTGSLIKQREASYATPEVISTLKNDDKNILIAEYPWREGPGAYYFDPDAKPTVYRLNVFTGQKQRITRVPLSAANVLVDGNDQVRFAVGRDAQSKLAVVWKARPDDDWTTFELPGFREQTVVPELFSADNRSVLFTGVLEKQAWRALYRLNLDSKEITPVFAFDASDVQGVVLDFARKEVVGVRGYTDKPIYGWLNAKDPAARVYSALHRAFAGHEVYVPSITDDGRTAVVFAGSDINPGDYFLFDTQKLAAEFFQPARHWIVPDRMRHKESVSIQASDGMKLQGYVTRPQGTGPFPMVVLPHGGPHGVRDEWFFDSEVQLLANRGYAVLQVNFRGSDGFGMDFRSAGYGEWGARMQDDITDATHWAMREKIADPERMCIFGASYGAYAALMGVVREPKLYRCAIGYAGVYDLELMFSSGDTPKSRTGRSFLKQALGEDRAQMHARSPTYNAKQIEAPVLLIHGTEDWRADFEQAKRMKAALQENGKQFEWIKLSGEGHGAYDEATRREVYERVLAFLDKYLKATQTAAR